MKKIKLLVPFVSAIPLMGAYSTHAANAMLEEIVVTAQRKAESLQDAAIPINAASGSELNRVGVMNAESLNKVAPALSASSGGGANSAYFVRGVGNFTNNGYTAPAVAFNIDGVYIGRPSSTISSFLDLNRVEVLKGPQGTLYGRNSTGGAINVIPNTPELGDTSASINLGYGNYSAKELTAVANVAVSDNSAIRVAATSSTRDGYFDDGTSEMDDTAFRVQFYTEPTDALRLRLSADYSTQEGSGSGVQPLGTYAFTPFASELPVANWQYVPLPSSVAGDYSGLHNAATLDYLAENVVGAPSFATFEGYAYPERDDQYWGVNAEINYDLGWADLTVIPSYRVSELDNQFNGPPFKAAINQDEAKQSSLEVRLNGSTDSFEWILGAYYFDENVQGVNAFNQFGTATHNRFDIDTESSALFARISYNLSDSARLVGGIRYTEEDRAIQGDLTATAIVCLEDPVGRPPNCDHVPTLPVALTLEDSLAQLDPALFPAGSPLDAEQLGGVYLYGPLDVFAPDQFGPGAIMAITPLSVDSTDGDEEVTYRVAFEYDLTLDNLMYVSYETGFRAGGFNLAVGRETYEPEYIDAYTFGSKNRFYDDRLEVNFEAFYWEYEDQQLSALGLDTDGNNAFYTRNVGAATIQGMELEFKLAAAENTLLKGSLQYLDAKYDSYSFTQVDLSDEGVDPPNFLTPVNGCDNTQVLFSGDEIIAYDAALETQEGIERGFVVDCSGKQAINAPEWTITLGVQQTFTVGDLSVIATLDGRYRDERELGFNYLPGGRADSDITLDSSITLVPASDGWELNFYVRNLTDETIASTYQLGAGNVVAAALEPPRTYGVRFGMNF